MTLTPTGAIPELDVARLVGPVRRSLGSPEALIIGWRSKPVDWQVLAPTTAGLHRVSGRARDASGEHDWTLILKVIKRQANATEDPSAPRYWRREADAFASGALEDLSGVRAPRWFGTEEVGGDLWLWLEQVVDAVPEWGRAEYVRAARALGTFGGSYGGGASRPVPDAPWLARGWLRSWIANVGPRSAKMVQDPATWEIPLVKRAFLRSIADRVLLLWERAPRLLDALDSLPATLCHQDAWRTNFIASRDARGRECTVLLDWAVVGLGPIGLDLGIFLTGNHFWLHADPAEIAEFDRETFAAYLEGIAASGCRIERRTARFAYVAAAALWGGLTAPVLFPQWGDPTRREWLEAKFRRSLDDAVAPSARVLEYMLDLGDEAWAFLEARY